MNSEALSTIRPQLQRGCRLHWDSVRKQYVLLAPEGVLLLNRTGATIVSLCDGKQTIGEIVEELRGKYKHVEVDEVQDFLTQLIARGWLGVGDE
jgi:pyrroloquinoline quinone biosynthesis protein D